MFTSEKFTAAIVSELPGVRFYKLNNLSGECLYLNIGNYNLTTQYLGNWDNCINSIKIDPRYHVTCYLNNTFNGNNIILKSDVLILDTLNIANKISSIKIVYI